MHPVGYLIQQHGVRLSRPVQAYDRSVKHYRSLVPLAQEARKPIFALAPADGAIGSHATAARGAFGDFRQLAEEILRRVEGARRARLDAGAGRR